MNRIFFYSILLMSVLITVSCTDDTDLENPVISVTSPTDGATFNTGGNLNFTITFSDDLQLGDYTIDVNPNFDNAPIDAWTESLSGTLTGQLELVEKDVMVPTDVAAGSYNIVINATDGEGKEATETTLNISIKNSADIDPPIVNITEPDPSLTLNLTTGVVFTIAGTLTDNIALHEFDIQIVDNSDDSVLLDNDFDLSGSGTTQSFSENIPAPLNAGIYTVVVTAIDGVNNRSEASIDLNVTE